MTTFPEHKKNKNKNIHIFVLDLTFIISPIYTIHVHTEKVSAFGGKVSRTSSPEQVLALLCLHRHFLNIITAIQ